MENEICGGALKNWSDSVVVQVSEIESQMDAAPQRALFLRAEPAVVSLVCSAILGILGFQLTGLQI